MDLDLISHRQTAVLNTVNVEHPGNIRNWVLSSKVKPLVGAQTLGVVIDSLDPVAAALSPYGEVSYVLDLKKPSAKGKPLELLTTLKLDTLLPQSPLTLGAYSGTDLSGLTLSGIFRNKLGLGDTLDFKGGVQPSPYGLGSGSADLSLPVPFPFVYNSHLGFKMFFLNQERQWASHSVESHGLGTYLSFPSRGFSSKIGLEATARQIHSLGDSASDTVRSAAANHATKVSVVGSVESGPLKFQVEQAGHPGDSSFLKLLASAHWIKPILAPFTLEFTGQAGYISGKPTVLDQFVVGGPGSVYGFKINSIGPKDGQDFIGAQCFYQSSVSLSSALPWLPRSPLRLVGTLNGAAAQLNTNKTAQENVTQLLSLNPSVAAAAGLTYRTAAGAFDLMYLHPLHANQGDIARKGLYFSVNLNWA